MTLRFSEALETALRETRRSLRSVALAANVSYEQLKKVKQGKSRSTNVDDALKIANAFGMSLDEFLNDTTTLLRSEAVILFAGLTDPEKTMLSDLARLRGIRAPREI